MAWSRRFLKVLAVVLASEVVLSLVMRAHVVIDFLRGERGHGWEVVLTTVAFLLVPVLAYAIVRIHRAQEDMSALIEDQRRANELIRETEQRTLRLMEDLPMAVFVTDPLGRPVYSNRLSVELMGLDADPSVAPEGLSEAYPVFVADTDQPYPTERLPVVRALAGETSIVDDMEIRHPDGRVTPLQVWGTPVVDRDGGIEYALATFMDISDRKRAEATLLSSQQAMRIAAEIAQEGRREAEAANRAKSDFLSRMSHELRTPLNGILGFSQLLEMDELQPDQRESVEHIRKAGRHLLDLINEVLDLARIEAGGFSISLEPVPIPEIVGECVTLIRPLAAERDIEIVVPGDGPEDGSHALADRQRLKQILLNLLSNAVKYNRRGGEIHIAWATSMNRVEIEVADTGSGIAPEKVHRLFTAFDRLGVSDEQEQGTGLGLALSKRLVEAMRGDLNAHSEVGRGSRFTIGLRVVAAPEELHDAEVPIEVEAWRPDRKRIILYIEDNGANVKLIERIFERRPDITLKTVTQGRHGLDLAREILPDLVLLDLNLPDINGDEVLLRLRQDPATSSLPVVLLSADATPRQIDRLMEAGAAAYITKPIDVAKLLNTIDDVLMGDEG